MPTKAIQVCGTGSGVGKSVIVAALGRIFLQDGYRVCPFKAQNMALNSFVTKEKGEIGRAQAVQAQACRLEPCVDMNPILIKPTSDVGAQVILRGKPIGNMSALRYTRYKSRLLATVRESYRRLARQYEVMVIEGAGSPAEVNLKSHDLVNLKMAAFARAPVILVGDIDKGGVFAWLIGTLQLLTKRERRLIKGIIINKFRGDISLLKGGIDFLERYTGIRVLGVIPYYTNIRVPEEDAVPLGSMRGAAPGKRRMLMVDVVYLPHISNFTDYDPLEREGDVRLRYVKRPEEMTNPDLIVIPGTKNTVSDLRYLMRSGFAKKIISAMDSGKASLVGVCGGYQMLGRAIYDSYGLESKCRKVEGLNMLPVETRLKKTKTLAQVKARKLLGGLAVSGYEIHHGFTRIAGDCSPAFEIIERNARKVRHPEGAISNDGRILGTYIHGIFDAGPFRRDFLNSLRKKKGWPVLPTREDHDPDKEFDKLAKLVRENLDMRSLHKILREGLG